MKRESIHLGVNSGATKFAIGRQAVNEAHFRCPDEAQRLPIVVEDGGISKTKEICYQVLGLVHEIWKPIPRTDLVSAISYIEICYQVLGLVHQWRNHLESQ